MAFPRKLLTPGEEVVVEANPNWSVLIRPVFIAVVIVGGWVAITLLWKSEPSFVSYLFAAIAALAVLWLVGQLISWRARLLVITTTRVVYRWGLVRRTGREIPLDRVQDVTYHQSLLERLLGAGSLTIESAGKSGQEPFPDVRHPAEIQSLINQLLSGDRDSWRRASLGRAQPGYAGSAAPAQQGPAPAQSAQPATQQAPAGQWNPASQQGQPGSQWSPATAPLPPVAPVPPVPPVAAPPARPVAAPIGGVLGEQLRDLERLHEAGVLTDDEFDRKRKELLGLN